ncbi:MAG: hypothetical protein IJA54_05015 [Tyzzerella sp.]|nr:hypothetical protein [Tyzzerella sp.]
MKRIIALLLAAIMVLSIMACGTTKEDDKENVKAPQTVGAVLLDEFKKNPQGTAQEIAERIIGNEIVPFMGGANPIEPGLLSGFDNAEITGFKEGCMFGPMMGTIPFLGYIFVLEDGADVDAFEKILEDNANLRWNICTEAEELTVESEGNTVFFLMSPKEFEEQQGE